MCTSSATESTRSLIVALLSFCIFRPKRDVVVQRHVREHRVVLEDHRDAPPSRRELGHVALADQDPARVDLLEAGEAAQQRRLAAARRAEQDDELAVGDRQAHVVRGDDLAEGLA